MKSSLNRQIPEDQNLRTTFRAKGFRAKGFEGKGLIVEEYSNSANTYYNMTVLHGNDSIDSLPWGTSGYTTKSLTDRYMDQKVRIVMEDSSGSYALAIHNGKELGLVDTRSLGDSFPRLARPY